MQLDGVNLWRYGRTAEGAYQINPRRLFHAQTWQTAQIIPIVIYWASYVKKSIDKRNYWIIFDKLE